MIRILYFTPSLGAGGAERNLVDLIANLDRTVYEPIVITLHSDNYVPYHFHDDLNNIDVPIYSLNMPFPPRRMIYYSIAIVRYLTFVYRIKPDIIQSTLFVSNFIARIARLFAPSHKLITNEQDGKFYPKRLKINRHTAFLADFLIPNSKQSHDILVNASISPQQLITIPLGVDISKFQLTTSNTLKKKLLSDASFLFLNVARIHPNKDQITLLEATKLLIQMTKLKFKVVIIGHVSSPSLFHQLQDFVHDNELSLYVSFLPPTQNIAPYYHVADTTILTSLSESFGLVTVESMTTGTPVIVSKAANAANAVDSANGWIFETGDAKALANCMFEATTISKSDLQEKGTKAQVDSQKFSLNTMIEQYENLYNQLRYVVK
jgi:glycosyltransferase involved in cell wall biosynthesis